MQVLATVAARDAPPPTAAPCSDGCFCNRCGRRESLGANSGESPADGFFVGNGCGGAAAHSAQPVERLLHERQRGGVVARGNVRVAQVQDRS